MTNLSNSDFSELVLQIRDFVDRRDWKNEETPKNLAIALSIEASELLENFQWLKMGYLDELGAEGLQNVKHELADVLIYLLAISDKLNINILEAGVEKMEINSRRYPK